MTDSKDMPDELRVWEYWEEGHLTGGYLCDPRMHIKGDKYISESKHKAEIEELLDKVQANVIANFRGQNEGLYNVKGFIKHLKEQL